MKSAAELLKIMKPESLFPSDPLEAKKQYHDLAKEWHPDAHKHADSESVFQHISVLYERALKKYADGSWDADGVLLVHSKEGSGWKLNYLVRHVFELGEYFVGDNSVVYLIGSKYKDLVDNALRTIQSFKYADAKMETESKRYLPQGFDTLETLDGRIAVRIAKTPDLVVLRDVIDYYHGSLDPKHIAWVQSSLHNLACYLNYAGISHQDISLDTYFVSPKHHNGALLGGWWYAVPYGTSLKGKRLPVRTFGVLPWEVQQKNVASPLTDLELVREIGRECGPVPDAMKTFFKSASPKSAVDDYKGWSDVLKQSFGERRFTKMDLDPETLYKDRR